MPNQTPPRPPVRCLCCEKPVPHYRRGINMLTEYCDCVCLAAHQTLQPMALEFWRAHCEKLPVSRHQARFDAAVVS
jgi:hypothetical protein